MRTLLVAFCAFAEIASAQDDRSALAAARLEIARRWATTLGVDYHDDLVRVDGEPRKLPVLEAAFDRWQNNASNRPLAPVRGQNSMMTQNQWFPRSLAVTLRAVNVDLIRSRNKLLSPC
jgi:hypothetical protein